ncbi:MAG: phosphatidate cytidylyltransferase [Victivallales bacterium]|nr:phosphatidate cytidylyltransferase [Victivallales bacterium]
MKKRLMTAIPLIAVVGLAFGLPGWYGATLFLLLSACMVICGCTEAFDMMLIEERGKQQLCICGYAVLMLLSICARFYSFGIALTALYIMLAFMLIFKEEPKRENVTSVIVSLGIAMYICWNLFFMARVYFLNGVYDMEGRMLLLYMIVCTKMADVGAYAIGSYTANRPRGNHKLSPRLSPKKSWEGLVGGTIFSVVAALAMLAIPGMTTYCGRPVFGIFSAIIFGILASVIGLVGDLAESAMKRAAGLKDSGRVPGLGGMLDVLDSLIFVAPLYYAYVVSVLW